MDIKETFLKLTSRTYPHGTESEVMHLLPQELDTDEFGNRFIQIGSSTCMFTSHLDTATSANTTIDHVIDGDIIKTDGFTILGADDKAGVTIMLNMIENKVPGLYYFFLGEEVGCVGSKKLSGKFATNKIENINKGADIIVATPGRFMDIYLAGHIVTKTLQVLVLDEAADLSFPEQV